MGFRLEKQDRLEWKKWLQRNHNILIECGLPVEMFENRRLWFYFLEHAAYWIDGGEYLVLDHLSQSQRRRLYEFLQAEFSTASYDPDALVVLKTMNGIPQRQYSSGEDGK